MASSSSRPRRAGRARRTTPTPRSRAQSTTPITIGLAGVIKVSLGLGQGEIPRTINFHKLNPQIELEGSPFYVVESNQRLKRDEHPYRACVSSFGIGGTNAHAILEQ